MKILSLNLWGGKAFSPLMEFLGKYNNDVDVFCFQEVFGTSNNVVETGGARANLLQELSNLFINYREFYYPTIRGVNPKGHVGFDLKFGLATFVKREIEIESEGDFFTYRSRFAPTKPDFTDEPSNVVYLNFNHNDKSFLVCNIHGIWYSGDKLDNPNRLAQTKKILEFIKKHEGPKVLCGDFNLRPETQSIKMLEQGLNNLVKECKIKTTRSPLDPFQGTKDFQSFADYTFVSRDIKVVDFQVPTVSVSDHLPMILEFE